jgi:N6-L-threonylcarbamoyladenine synthase
MALKYKKKLVVSHCEWNEAIQIDQQKLKMDCHTTARNDINFKRIFLAKESFDFSFSWIKSQVSMLLRQLEEKSIPLTEDLICEIAYEFQEAVVEVLSKKLVRAGAKYSAKTLGISGWVSANDRLWEYANTLIFHKNYKNLNFNLLKPCKKIYSTDNAAMIWVAGILQQNHML